VPACFSQYLFRNTGKPRPAKDAVKTATRRKSSEWSALEKPVALPSPPPAGKYRF
jgi:hypothetical protein